MFMKIYPKIFEKNTKKDLIFFEMRDIIACQEIGRSSAARQERL